jgi:hypothetical protein
MERSEVKKHIHITRLVSLYGKNGDAIMPKKKEKRKRKLKQIQENDE